MGDNVYLGDRNGVRTPMQWSGDRNAGFSSANRQQLYLPVITDPEYHYEAVNVEVQQANPHSLLWWMKRLHRPAQAAPGVRRAARSSSSTRRTGRSSRSCAGYEDETILVVANLSRFVQHTELDLSELEGRVPIEMFGRVEFPAISGAPYFLTLAPHSFLWFSLEAPVAGPDGGAGGIPTLVLDRPLEELAADDADGLLAKALIRSLPSRRWFRGKARTIKATKVTDAIVVREPGCAATVVTLAVDYTEGESELYLLPLTTAPPSRGGADAGGVTRSRAGAPARTRRQSDRGRARRRGARPGLHDDPARRDRRAAALQGRPGRAARRPGPDVQVRPRRERRRSRPSRSDRSRATAQSPSATGSSSSSTGRSSTASTRISRSGGS